MHWNEKICKSKRRKIQWLITNRRNNESWVKNWGILATVRNNRGKSMVFLEKKTRVPWGGIHVSEKIDYFRISFSLWSALTLDVSFVTLVPLILFYRTQDLHVCNLVKRFESLSCRIIRPLDTAQPWFTCPCLVLSMLFRHQDIYKTLLASGSWLEHSIICRLS